MEERYSRAKLTKFLLIFGVETHSRKELFKVFDEDDKDAIRDAMFDACLKARGKDAFTDNVVEIVLEKPSVKELLVLYDTPGLIQAVGEDEDPADIQKIKDMVYKHITPGKY